MYCRRGAFNRFNHVASSELKMISEKLNAEIATAEIEITEAMAEAGADQLYQDDITETKREWAARIYSAMIRASE
jgi:hypothetical protein